MNQKISMNNRGISSSISSSFVKTKTDLKKEEKPKYLPKNKNPNLLGKKNSKKKTKIPLEPPFAKVEMPSLYCFSMNLQELTPNTNQSRKLLKQQQKLEMRDKKRLIFTKKLHKMYQLAMAHQATFARILARHSDDFGPDMDPLRSAWANNDERKEVEENQLRKILKNRESGGTEEDNEQRQRKSEAFALPGLYSNELLNALSEGTTTLTGDKEEEEQETTGLKQSNRCVEVGFPMSERVDDFTDETSMLKEVTPDDGADALLANGLGHMSIRNFQCKEEGKS